MLFYSSFGLCASTSLAWKFGKYLKYCYRDLVRSGKELRSYHRNLGFSVWLVDLFEQYRIRASTSTKALSSSDLLAAACACVNWIGSLDKQPAKSCCCLEPLLLCCAHKGVKES